MKWFLGVILILLVALVLESGLLAYAMYVLLGLMVLSRFLTRSWIGCLEANRECANLTAEISDTIDVAVTIKSTGWLPVPWVLIEDLLPRKALSLRFPRLRVLGKRIKLVMLRPRGEIQLQYQLTLKARGYYQIGPLVLETGDLFGLHRRYRVVTEPQFVLVYPSIVPLLGYDLASRRPIGEVLISHRLYEDPTRIAGVREYQAGDPLSRVHWRATARTGELHCKVYEPSTLAGTTILLDFHEAGYPLRVEPMRSELAVTTASSLANAVCLLGQQVGLVTNGRDAANRIRLEGWETEHQTRRSARASSAALEKDDRLQPLVVETRRNEEQLQRIREVLARLELTDGLAFDHLVYETASRLPRDATVTAILPDVPEESALALGSLHRRGFAVSVILIIVEEIQMERCVARLRAESILDVRHLLNEVSLPALCQHQASRATPYTMATD